MIAALIFAATVHPQTWQKFTPPQKRAAMEKKIDALRAHMTIKKKGAQTTQPSVAFIPPADLHHYHFGSVLNGGGGFPGDIRKVTPRDWLSLADAFYDASMDSPLQIPVMWGADAVHGHNNVIGATIFPHNIGRGAANDPELERRIGDVTGVEMKVTGLDWDFFPTVAVVQDARWGRTYESYSEDPALVARLAKAFVTGLQHHVLATSKHFLGD